ncbi:retroviral-like aspartic protease family protein [Chryseobacterium sp. B21-037]|uniref:retropepsin-like aspartic protease n=1 Tax=Chryseobacterium sp. B21-037 TaxID=2926038 RepID=UPI002358B68D|nr:retropepsin-like aspartic protease [Chryseobacterium sp. B21-037]MDC8103648.1 retroviral-like aspartic protease family protein [Chryseobacterium sp. B21-037]
MKQVFSLFFLFILIMISAQGKRFFESGEVQLTQPVERINLNFINDLPLVKVNINGKLYNFLFDSGAPTVISNTIYTELNLQKEHTSKVKDSQKNKQEQIFTKLPEMTVDNVVFKNIGAIVMDLNGSELGCFKIDGIIGANQMAKLFWKVNYSENLLEATKDLSNFKFDDYETVVPFDSQNQKTPVVETKILDKNIRLTFDTGFTGRLKILESDYDQKKIKQYVETYGISSVGAFGAGKPVSGFIFKMPALGLGNRIFDNEMVMTGNSRLIGNDFFKDFAFIMDWQNKKIYMKKIKNDPPTLESFGFGYRFIDAKPVVAFIFKGESSSLEIGDSILSINDVDLDHLNKESACHYMMNRVERDYKTIGIRVKRAGNIMDLRVDKKEFLK